MQKHQDQDDSVRTPLDQRRIKSADSRDSTFAEEMEKVKRLRCTTIREDLTLGESWNARSMEEIEQADPSLVTHAPQSRLSIQLLKYTADRLYRGTRPIVLVPILWNLAGEVKDGRSFDEFHYLSLQLRSYFEKDCADNPFDVFPCTDSYSYGLGVIPDVRAAIMSSALCSMGQASGTAEFWIRSLMPFLVELRLSDPGSFIKIRDLVRNHSSVVSTTRSCYMYFEFTGSCEDEGSLVLEYAPRKTRDVFREVTKRPPFTIPRHVTLLKQYLFKAAFRVCTIAEHFFQQKMTHAALREKLMEINFMVQGHCGDFSFAITHKH